MRILLIEDHPIVRTACRRLLQARSGMEIAEAATAADGLSMALAFQPDIIVLDLKLPDGNGLDLIGPLMEHAPDRKVIVFSMYEDPVFAARAFETGAKGYMTKSDDPDVLLQAIDKVDAGKKFLTPSMAEKLALMTAAPEDDPLRVLSGRERQVLVLLGEGKTLAEIADELQVSYRTSAYIAAQMKTKLRITSMAALIKWAVDHQRMPSNAE
jgi:DNA-binding NarL/FixJ family response regulator